MYDHYLTLGCAAGPLQRGTKQMVDNKDHDLMKALDDWDSHHLTIHKSGVVGAGIDICKTYALAKPVLVAILPFLSFIPVVGSRIVPVLQALMAGLDSFCKVTP